MIWKIRYQKITIQNSKKEKKEKEKGDEDSLRGLWVKIKHTNISIIQVPEEKRERKELKTYLKN